MANPLSRWTLSAVLALGLGALALSPAPARAQDGDELVRVLVDMADVMFSGGTPYYRGDYRDGRFDRGNPLIVVRDRFGRSSYYRHLPRRVEYRRPGNRHVQCNSHGKCKVTYYDARHDRRYDRRYTGHDRYGRYDRYRDVRRWRDDDDRRYGRHDRDDD